MSARPADFPSALPSPRGGAGGSRSIPGKPRPSELMAPCHVPTSALTAAVASVFTFCVLALALRGVLPAAS
jgi:hypothetical protein